MQKIIGIVAEYNPFHNGHLYQINKIKDIYPNSLIIVCMSSSFTQRGDISLLNKWEKTEICLNHGIDVIIELPYAYTTQGSDIFAKYSIELLNALKDDYPMDELYLIIGADNIVRFNEWKNVETNS